MTTISVLKHNRVLIIFVILLLILFTVVLLRTAWLADDAYITFRTVDNFVNGYGLTWNTAERVETYSNPLWMFLVAVFYFFTNEIYFTSIILSISISVLVLSVFAFKLSKSLTFALLGIGIFTLSKAFIDYSTSGMENPLTHLILAAFLFFYIKDWNNFTFKTLFVLSVITALGGVNRLDTLVLFLPCLVYAFSKLPKLKGLYVIAIGLLPLIAWKGFTLFYYGFPFPNTAYAKVINSGLGASELVPQGLYFFENSLKWDPITLVVIFSAMTVPFLIRKNHLIPIVIGIALYFIFIIQSGGDFMSGRYFTAPLFMGVVLISQINFKTRNHMILLGIFSGIVIVIGVTADYSPLFSDETYSRQPGGHEIIVSEHGIADERGWYYQSTGLLRKYFDPEFPVGFTWARGGIEAKEAGITPIMKGSVGFIGFYSGPTIHIIDFVRITEPLLSKLPPTKDPNWRIGHFKNSLPAGYFDTIKSGSNVIQNKDLALYYDKLSIITQGDLLDSKRLEEIWKINTGEYDHLLCSIIKGHKLRESPDC